VVAVNQELLAKIWTDPLQWQELAIFKFKPDEIHRFSRVTEHEESLVRTSSKDWKWIKGEGEIDKTNLESLLNTLASLRAVRWIGATTAAHGFDKPQLVSHVHDVAGRQGAAQTNDRQPGQRGNVVREDRRP
jgi:hypothetical protein